MKNTKNKTISESVMIHAQKGLKYKVSLHMPPPTIFALTEMCQKYYLMRL